MKPISELMLKEATRVAEACVRVTGKSLEEWEAVYRWRRVKDLGSKLTGQRLFTEYEMGRCVQFYGLDSHDFERVIVKTGGDVVLKADTESQLSIVTPTSEQLHEITTQELIRKNVVVMEGVLTGKNPFDKSTQMRSVIRYRLPQEILRRIADERSV